MADSTTIFQTNLRTYKRIGETIEAFKWTLAEKAIETLAKEVCRLETIPIRTFTDDMFTNAEGHALKVGIGNLLTEIAKKRAEKQDG